MGKIHPAKKAYKVLEKMDLSPLEDIYGVDVKALFMFDVIRLLGIVYVFSDKNQRARIIKGVKSYFGFKNSRNIIEDVINKTETRGIIENIFSKTPFAPSFLLKLKELDLEKTNMAFYLTELIETIVLSILYPDGRMIVDINSYLIFAYAENAKNKVFAVQGQDTKSMLLESLPSFQDVIDKYTEDDLLKYEKIVNCAKAKNIFKKIRKEVSAGRIEAIVKKSINSNSITSYHMKTYKEASEYIREIDYFITLLKSIKIEYIVGGEKLWDC